MLLIQLYNTIIISLGLLADTSFCLPSQRAAVSTVDDSLVALLM